MKVCILRIWWEMRDLDIKALLSTSGISLLVWRLFQILKSIKCYTCFLLLFEKNLYLVIEIQNIWKNKFNIAICIWQRTETDSLCKIFQLQYLLFKVIDKDFYLYGFYMIKFMIILVINWLFYQDLLSLC